MTPDQYRREGAEAMRQRASQILDHYDEYDRQLCCDGQMCGCQGSTVHQMIQYFIRAIDVDEVLSGLRPRCAECDCEDGNCTWIKAGPADECDEGVLPCPFCGGPAEIVEIDKGENAGGSFVRCTRCFASGNVEFGFKENFISNWNHRVQTLAPDAVARLVEAAQFTRNRLEIIASDAWNGDARDFKRSLMGIFSEFDEALAAMETDHD